MVCARAHAIMLSSTLVHYRYVHVHNHGISKTCNIIARSINFLVFTDNFFLQVRAFSIGGPLKAYSSNDRELDLRAYEGK